MLVTLQTATAVRLRAAPGADQPILAEFRPSTVVYALSQQSQPRSGLTWLPVVAYGLDGVWRSGWSATALGEQSLLLPWQPSVALAYPFARPWPITQLFGENPATYQRFGLAGHNGLDFGAPLDTPVLAADEGVVSHSRHDPAGYGLYVRLAHPWGISLYAHLNQLSVDEGQTVSCGQALGLTGNSGNSSGPHLHFEIRPYPLDLANGFTARSDPLPYLPLAKLQLPAYAPAELRQCFQEALWATQATERTGAAEQPVIYGKESYTDANDPRHVSARGHSSDQAGRVTGLHVTVHVLPTARYRCSGVSVQGEETSRGQTLCVVRVKDKQGHLCAPEPIVLATGYNGSIDQWDEVLPAAQRRAPWRAELVLSGAPFVPPNLGPAAVFIADSAGRPQSDVVANLGLPWRRHINVLVEFQER